MNPFQASIDSLDAKLGMVFWFRKSSDCPHLPSNWDHWHQCCAVCGKTELELVREKTW